MDRVGFTREMVLGFREFRALAWLRVKGAASKNGTRPRVDRKDASARWRWLVGVIGA